MAAGDTCEPAPPCETGFELMADGENCCLSGQVWSNSGSSCVWADPQARASWEADQLRQAEEQRAAEEARRKAEYGEEEKARRRAEELADWD
jgi:hypothetical protein